ncbi:phosphatidate cytidylyltransferase [Evansella cellulosilytica]|uniref:Phosphatidate cytidylyltransferase n=1 Tax=Evansella cellulosilytica (strain ATCC 21833 / DSM 2522 / FERM P-1141 / JCM 9156 / N-4) TaxID=649639 RepID=E6TW80_EVAC2|nr:phosphatidate cytidylyltransferase [Evansella cellulosilytica]ADU31036.1 phosphatidate cytidylyltransferase [Evansella cellulosilytica DSM 2522]
MSQIYTYLYIIFIVLMAISIVVLLINYFKKKNDYDELVVRTRLWWGMAIIFSISLIFSPTVSLVSLAFLCFLALKEYFSMIKTRKQDRRVYKWAYLAIPLHFYWIYIGWYGMFLIFIPIYVFLFLPVIRIVKSGSIGFLNSVASTQWGLMLMVFGISHLALFPKLIVITETEYELAVQYGGWLVLYLVVLTQGNDVIQYLVSKKLGKRKIIPHANPNLTWEGLTTGIILITLLSIFLARYLTPMDFIHSIFAGIIISVGGFFGTAVVSVVKRNLVMSQEVLSEIKQDRYINKIDSLTYTAPLFFHYVYYLYY